MSEGSFVEKLPSYGLVTPPHLTTSLTSHIIQISPHHAHHTSHLITPLRSHITTSLTSHITDHRSQSTQSTDLHDSHHITHTSHHASLHFHHISPPHSHHTSSTSLFLARHFATNKQFGTMESKAIQET